MSQLNLTKRKEVIDKTDRKRNRGQLDPRNHLGAFSNILVDQFSLLVCASSPKSQTLEKSLMPSTLSER